MNQDTLIQALVTHLDPDAVLEAKRNGTMFSYYVTLAQNILGNNAQTQAAAPRRQVTRQPARQTAVDLNEEQPTNETEQPIRETNRPAPARPTRATAKPAGDRVGIRQL